MYHNVYYAWVSNDQGASADVEGREHSRRKIEDAARSQFGAGWTVHVMCVDVDSQGGGVFGVSEINSFRLRK